MRKRANGSSLPPGRHIAKSTKQVVGSLTTGQFMLTLKQAYDAAQKEVGRHKGRSLNDPRVFIIVEQDFINE